MEKRCPNNYTSDAEFNSKFMIDSKEGEKCLKCRALHMDDSEGLITCTVFNKEEEYDN